MFLYYSLLFICSRYFLSIKSDIQSFLNLNTMAKTKQKLTRILSIDSILACAYLCPDQKDPLRPKFTAEDEASH